MQANYAAKADSVVKALVNRYTRTDSPLANIDQDGVIALLASIPEEAMVGEVSLLSILEDMSPQASMPANVRAVLSSVDDCLSQIFSSAELEIEVVQQIHFAIPRLAAELIKSPDLPFCDGPSVLTILDQLAQGMLGWTSHLGKAGDRLYEKTAEVIAGLQEESADFTVLDKDVADYFEREQTRITRLEERLIASEMGLARSQQSKRLAATVIDGAMAGKKLTRGIAAFLKGPWFDSMQLIALTRGTDSAHWSRAAETTENLIWSYQPRENRDPSIISRERHRLYHLIEHMPEEIRELLVALEHTTSFAEDALEMIETDLVSVASGQTLHYQDFTPIEAEEPKVTSPQVSRESLEELDAFEPGQWFIYEADDVLVRIKLVLKLDDVKQMLFTDRNGVKIMRPGFDEFADYLSSGLIRPCDADAIFTSTFKSCYERLIEEQAREMRHSAENQAAIDRGEQQREPERQQQREAAAALAREKAEAERARIEQERQKRLEHARQAMEQADAATIAEFEKRVEDLALGAWLELPGLNEQQERCKLAVRIPARDKLIFVNRSGMKVGEYSSAQLVQVLVAGQGEIQDDGSEFDDALAEVLTRLRQDRNRIDDDLTGHNRGRRAEPPSRQN